ncbi:hypothetical protein BRE01_67750 [Brevibacillus reuszeri]|uniref:Abortive infection protein n=1 Tax=Brevibacillus reuszeri TaxID=54915 RepID=A0A0K9YZQ4_9BACL|nr:hypothetical protein [Brevibacillus reuszeri]KNB74213.1 hypothetical protein ADS79_03365 [Brevibacillus reuszeri]MED1861206.1 hypothetical protein [Brevibacillus reuszeri]GED73073.1 hypothetical protein BRE01_67750 [Brevibacillus reuszeri]
MRMRGVTYDTGFLSEGASTHPNFEATRVHREMEIIRRDLHCTAVRVTGGEPVRLEIAAQAAAAAGLEVWFSPFTNNLNQEELLALLGDCAERAERLRVSGTEVVMVTGAELMLFTSGFFPGETLPERLAALSDPTISRAAFAKLPTLLNGFLARAVDVVRARFGGRVTYAALPSEPVNWEPFDFIAVDAYNSAEVSHLYADSIKKLASSNKPLVISEFGCTTFKGAIDLGAHGMFIVEWDGARAVRLTGSYERDESEQSQYFNDSFNIFEEAGVDTAFWCTFASHNLPYDEDPNYDFDRASYGIVRVLQENHGTTYSDMPWEPKEVFYTIAARYADVMES